MMDVAADVAIERLSRLHLGIEEGRVEVQGTHVCPELLGHAFDYIGRDNLARSANLNIWRHLFGR